MAKIKVRARTVDMLGRQQIAGIPTAISELFKNAHDAYAKNVVVDYYEYDDLFVLRDDGLGMSKDEFESNWLTLGTESKLIENASSLVDPEQKARAVLGEKGIGRLAVAALGPQVFILTRAKQIEGKNRSQKLVAAYINWDVFSLPQIDLVDVEIPIREFEGSTLPTVEDVSSMVSESAVNLETIAPDKDSKEVQRILSLMSKFDFDPQECINFLPVGPTFNASNDHGTHFYIKPADSIIKEDIALDSVEPSSTLVKMLIGFTNTMSSSRRKVPLIAEFRQHSNEGAIKELIGPNQFFTEDEARNADHQFIGRFDQYGHFKGKVRIYGQAPLDYETGWNNSSKKKTSCGPFNINFAYVQGSPSESILPSDEFALISSKLNTIGGIYIYRDGIRILPYGDSDYDFLDIEKRRTKGMGYYFFSYRRIFGAIELTKSNNQNLVEKAGREGFRENKAYREFRGILKNFFIQLAADFFREGGINSEIFDALKKEIKQKDIIKREREKKAKRKRNELAHQLETFFLHINNDFPQTSIDDLKSEIKNETTKLKRKRSDQKTEIARILKESRNMLAQIKASLRITKPQGVGLSKELAHDFKSFETEWERLENELFLPAEHEIELYISDVLNYEGQTISKSDLITLGLEGKTTEYKEIANDLITSSHDELNCLQSRVNEQSIFHFNNISESTSRVLDQASSTEFAKLTDSQIKTLQVNWDNEFRECVEPEIDKLKQLVTEISSLFLPNSPSADELTEVLEEELVELKESLASQNELLQLGMALGVIHHEFRSCVRGLRESLRKLKRWADSNQALAKLYSEIRTNFDHLDGYLTLFTPLTRRLNRKKIDISGSEINKYLQDLFSQRFDRHQIKLVASLAFRKHILFEYPSSIFPCFVNLVDNSCFWLSDRRGERNIYLDMDGEDILLSDTGPGIHKRDVERIFDLGFTRKPSGQGMGLHVCKQTFDRIGYEITLDPPQRGKGVVFRIRHRDKK
ncbi:ATP-binding protein [Gimesia algae]|uniref:histidine kinase n=1 Tax=Gimesia algae TaxID=2527971 RepID=A0A517VLS8_9PLAN|nr:ATP-binding protein [Gimesia algae]QDT93850.1 sensory histidine kinase AtoS [Gimesia algae]